MTDGCGVSTSQPFFLRCCLRTTKCDCPYIVYLMVPEKH